MLPDFPLIKKVQADGYNNYLQKSVRGGDPLLRKIRHKTIHEGDRSVIEDDGQAVDDPFEKFEDKLEIKVQEVIEKGIEAFYEAANALIEEIQERQVHLIFQRIDESTRRTGNIVDGSDKDLATSFLESLEKVQIEFDSDGKPELEIVASAKMRDRMLELNSDSELKIRFDQIIAKKREEWLDRENNRKLVD